MDQQAQSRGLKTRKGPGRHSIAGLAGTCAGAVLALAFAQAAPIEARAVARTEPVAVHASYRAPDAVRPLYVFTDPVAGYEIISPFGLRKLPWEEQGRLHAGVDVAAPAGYPVVAAADGVVLRAGYDGGYGRFIDIRHVGGLVTRYAHLGAILDGVQPGLMVGMGEEIALIGNTGSSTGSHLHFEIRDDAGRPLNPEFFLGHEFAGPEDLPLRAAARIPRRMRVAYVSYIPRKKRELMEAREAGRDPRPADLKVAAPSESVRLTRAEVFEAVKVAPSQPAGIKPVQTAVRPKIVQPRADGVDAPIITRRPDPFGAGGDLPGWPASDG